MDWSMTRVRTYQDCPRKYYFTYHLAREGRRPDAPERAVWADETRHLTGLEAWMGRVVHEVVEEALIAWKAGRAFGEEKALSRVRRYLKNQHRDSWEYQNANREAFKKRPSLLDHHYYQDRTLTPEAAAELREKAEGAVSRFFRSDIARRIRGTRPGDRLPIESQASAHLEDGILLRVRPDCAFRDVEGGRRCLRIVDWKTGKTDSHWETVQAVTYALYAAEKWFCDVEEIVVTFVHLLPELECIDVLPTPALVADVLGYIRETGAQIQEMEGALTTEEAFPCASDPRCCRWCQFRERCPGAQRLQTAG